MKKILLLIAILLIVPVSVFGANWFAGTGDTDFNAVSGGTTSSVWNSNSDGTSGTYLDWSTQPANGDIFVANGQTIAIDDNIGSSSVQVTLTTEGTDYGGTDGGGFTLAIPSTGNTLALYTHIASGTNEVLTLSGTGTGTLNIYGNITTATDYGIKDGRTAGTVNFTGNITGGPASTITGYYKSANGGIIVIAGDVTAGTGSLAHGIDANSYYATITINGSVAGGGAAGVTAHGCYCPTSGSGSVTITGNIINSLYSTGAVGKYIWNPASAKNYMKIWNGSTNYLYLSAGLGSDSDGTQITGENTAAQVKTGTYFVKKDDGVFTQGSATAGSGGAGAYAF